MKKWQVFFNICLPASACLSVGRFPVIKLSENQGLCDGGPDEYRNLDGDSTHLFQVINNAILSFADLLHKT